HDSADRTEAQSNRTSPARRAPRWLRRLLPAAWLQWLSSGIPLRGLRKHIAHCGFQLSRLHIFHYARITNSYRQYKARDSADVFLVAYGGSHHFGDAQLQRRQRAVESYQVLQPLELRARNCPSLSRQVKRSHHAPAHSLSVQQGLVVRRLLQRVAHRVAKVQNHAQAALALVQIHH